MRYLIAIVESKDSQLHDESCLFQQWRSAVASSTSPQILADDHRINGWSHLSVAYAETSGVNYRTIKRQEEPAVILLIHGSCPLPQECVVNLRPPGYPDYCQFGRPECKSVAD
ncbi:hypothetical protein PoB_006560100 [Plakobranchus ocellatus]|uniref:Uncharacterized protein n=1 Tax=Plakobranchus ocellatus TaxID=259542 RepID=A0AAV4D4S7_9GAST|nr:hypothetical protein PoB_006560100 [Plakobranchus ocellatus]